MAKDGIDLDKVLTNRYKKLGLTLNASTTQLDEGIQIFAERKNMAPPCYADLGKSSKDIFNKGYNTGVVKLDCKTTTKSGIGFTVSGTSNNETNKVNASLETKYKWNKYGLTFTEKWTTDNILNTEISMEDQMLKGMKLGIASSFTPQSGKKSGKFKATYKHDYLVLDTDVDFNIAGPILNACAVLGFEGWLAGYQMAFDSGKGKLTKSNFAVGYSVGDFTVHSNVNDGQEFGGSIYQRVNSQLETGIQLAWQAGSNNTRFGLGCKYQLDRDASFRAKINNSSQIGLGYTQKLRDGVEITLSGLIEGANINSGGHKLGLGVNLEA
ncbi:Voltage-dependent anion-selective channel protein 2 [Nymphon striatum]|nr:Voltage-dependent anion-selective channel protein 2 [Nymphon striatum]